MSKLSPQELLVKRVISGARRGGMAVDKMRLVVDGDRVELLPFDPASSPVPPGGRLNALDKRLGLT